MSLPLTMMLRPPGCGLHSPSLGTNPSAADLLSTMYGTHDPNRIEAAWRDSLRAIPNARILLLGVPSDTGAGGRRGAAYGPIGVREALYAGPRITNLIDVGDICCVPHLLHDDMLNGAQLGNTRAALYGSADAPYPASPLSIVAAVCSELRRLAPTALILTIGGDHSISACTIGGVVPDSITRWGLLHFDAHADRSKSRFGVALTYGS
jgi:agmatinase